MSVWFLLFNKNEYVGRTTNKRRAIEHYRRGRNNTGSVQIVRDDRIEVVTRFTDWNGV